MVPLPGYNVSVESSKIQSEPPMSQLTNRKSSRQQRFELLCRRLCDIAYKEGPGAKMPTALELRDNMGVSMATLASALRELESQNIIVRKHGVGIYVSPNLHQKSIALVCDPAFFSVSNLSPFWSMLIEYSRHRATEHNEAFSLHLATPAGTGQPPLQETLWSDIQNGRIDGLIAIGLDLQAAEWLEEREVKFVTFAGPGPYRVTMDGAMLAQIAVRELVKEGCQRIAYWGGLSPHRHLEPEKPDSVSPVQVAMEETLKELAWPFDASLIEDNRHLIPEGGVVTISVQEQGYHTAMRVFSRPKNEWPDGIYIGDDIMTQGALAALQKLDLRAGRDVKMASHANRGSSVLMGYEDDLILIEQDPMEVVQALFDLLEPLLDGRKPPQNEIAIMPKLRRS